MDSSDANVPQYIKNLKQVLQEEACDIEHLVVSHWHHDHIGGVPDVLKITTPSKMKTNSSKNKVINENS